jgi:DNA gyrase subunit B
VATKPVKEEYGADQLQKLDPMDHIRKRVSMYLGDNTGEGGKSVALREILDNAQDEFLNGHGNKIILTFFSDGSAEVQDSGRGIPTGINKATGENGIVLALAHVGAGGKFGSAGNGYAAGAGGLNGVGAAATQATSERFDVTVYRENKEHKMSFSKGKPGHWDKPNDPKAKFTENRDLIISPDKRPTAEKKARPTGTTIRVWADPDIFVPGAKYDIEGIKFRLRSTAFLLPGLHIEVNDLTDPAKPVHDVYDFDGGIAEMLSTIAPDNALIKPVHFQTKSSFTEMASIIDEHGHMRTGEVERPVDIDVAFQYGEGYDTTMKSFVNIINTKHGGTHESGFYRALSRVLIDAAKNTRGLLKAKEEAPTLEDVKEGLTAIISIKFPEPQFVGQEKSTLGTSAITSVVSQAVAAELKKFIDDKKNAATVKLMLSKIVEASRIRQQQRNQKETARKKSALESSSSMPPKLVECEMVGHADSELLLVEGDSALGTMRGARDSRFQALLPLRGKVLNVYKATASAMLANAECAAMIQVMGAGSGRTFDLDAIRYGKIIIETDADVDGAHIKSLLITFFWKYMRPFVEAGKLYAAIPPLYAVKVHGKSGEVFYAADGPELAAITKKLDARKAKYDISRNKGLGEMDVEPTWDTLLNPATRRVKQIVVDDITAAEGMLELAMGSDVPPRKQWITDSRHKLAPEDLEV